MVGGSDDATTDACLLLIWLNKLIKMLKNLSVQQKYKTYIYRNKINEHEHVTSKSEIKRDIKKLKRIEKQIKA